MSAKLLKGKDIALEIITDVRTETDKNSNKPHIVAINIGNNDESAIYLKSKSDMSHKAGIIFTQLNYDNLNTDDLLKKIDELNLNDSIHGIIVQLPLPINIDPTLIFQSIVP
jgi:methylenetetrahydrofolate dehydrogenase (NADP+)/methenyltetrahydrofolate cyclohydrolase